MNLPQSFSPLRSFSSAIDAAKVEPSAEFVMPRPVGAELGGSHDILGEDELRAIDAEARENERLAAALQSLLTDLQKRTDRLIDDHCATVVGILRDVVRGFADFECESLRQAIAYGHSGRVWSCDATLLWQELEECFAAACREAQQEIGGLESHLFPMLKQLLIRHNPRWRGMDAHGGVGGGADPPVLGALSEVVVLALDKPSWKRWWVRGRCGEGRIAELDRLIRHEFDPMTDALAQAARAHLETRQASVLQQARAVCLGLVETLEEQSLAWRTHALISGGEPPCGAGSRRALDPLGRPVRDADRQIGAPAAPAAAHRADMQHPHADQIS